MNQDEAVKPFATFTGSLHINRRIDDGHHQVLLLSIVCTMYFSIHVVVVDSIYFL